MPRRQRPLEGVKGEQPPQTLHTVWHYWHPAPEGPTTAALRAYLIAVDQMAAGEQVPESDLAELMFAVYTAATAERIADVHNSIGSSRANEPG